MLSIRYYRLIRLEVDRACCFFEGRNDFRRFFFLLFFLFFDGDESGGDESLSSSSSSSLGDGIRLRRIFGSGFTSISLGSLSTFSEDVAGKSPLSAIRSSVGSCCFRGMRFAGFGSGMVWTILGVDGRTFGVVSGLSLPVFSISSKETNPDLFVDAGLSCLLVLVGERRAEVGPPTSACKG